MRTGWAKNPATSALSFDGIDSDNGSEFVNHHLFDDCTANKITFTNYLLPQQKLAFTQSNGAKVTKLYDTATTPHQRAIADTNMRKRPVIQIDERRVHTHHASSPITADPRPHWPAGNPRLAKKPTLTKPAVNRVRNG